MAFSLCVCVCERKTADYHIQFTRHWNHMDARELRWTMCGEFCSFFSLNVDDMQTHYLFGTAIFVCSIFVVSLVFSFSFYMNAVMWFIWYLHGNIRNRFVCLRYVKLDIRWIHLNFYQWTLFNNQYDSCNQVHDLHEILWQPIWNQAINVYVKWNEYIKYAYATHTHTQHETAITIEHHQHFPQQNLIQFIDISESKVCQSSHIDSVGILYGCVGTLTFAPYVCLHTPPKPNPIWFYHFVWLELNRFPYITDLFLYFFIVTSFYRSNDRSRSHFIGWILIASFSLPFFIGIVIENLCQFHRLQNVWFYYQLCVHFSSLILFGCDGGYALFFILRCIYFNRIWKQ